MVNNISWGSYWSVLSIVVICYYVYVGLAYYRSDLLQRFQPSGKQRNPIILPKESPEQNHPLNGDDKLLPVVQSFTDEMTAYLEQAAHAGAVKEEIIFALRRLIKKHAILKDSPYQQAVIGLIQFECENKCAVTLSAEELNRMWLE